MVIFRQKWVNAAFSSLCSLYEVERFILVAVGETSLRISDNQSRSRRSPSAERRGGCINGDKIVKIALCKWVVGTQSLSRPGPVFRLPVRVAH